MYLCKYGYQFTGEIIEGLASIIQYLRKLPHFNILSLGCGPCTELFASYKFANHLAKSVDYRGVDLTSTKWSTFHNSISSLQPDSVHFIYDDCLQYLSKLEKESWRPNIIFMNYLISSLCKVNSQPEQNKCLQLIDIISLYFKEKCASGSVIFLNDINNRGTATDYFDKIAETLDAKQDNSAPFHILVKGHFDPNYQSNSIWGYPEDYKPNDYGCDFGVRKVHIPDELQNMSTKIPVHRYLSSAQLIIRKN